MSQPDIVKEFQPLFLPGSVAVIGASNNWAKWGNSTFTSLMNGYKGDLYAVNNHETEILGYHAYSKVTEIPGSVDLVVIVIPPERVAGVMEDCVRKGVKAGVIITAGFAETGAKGKAMQDEVVAIARKGGIRLVGPNCMGMWSAAGNLPAFMFSMRILEGPLALISQGGNIGGALVADATARGIGFRQYVSCGCTADIQIEDYIEYLGYDDTVKVIMVYIEGLSIDNRFVKKVKSVTRKKPVIALKPGKTEAAARAISSHSGSLSGTDSIYDAAFNNSGVIRVESTTELLDVAIAMLIQPLPRGDVAIAMLIQPLPRGRNVVITTPGGSYGVMCAEACAMRDLNVMDLPNAAMETFNSMFPARWSHGNPVDPAGDRDFLQYLKAPEVVLQCPEVDGLIFMGFGSFSSMSSVFASGMSGPSLVEWVKRLEGFEEMLRSAVSILESGDTVQIKEAIKPIIKTVFSTMMPTKALEMDAFLETILESFSYEKMMQSSFFNLLNRISVAITTGDEEGLETANIMDLLDFIPGALVNGLIQKFGKPVITTTFTEETSRISAEGHYPYPNSDRASNVLAKLVEYKEYLERDEKEGD
ncbi:MAG: CoA-binding protein [Deltaproteobacteria bacterium]|nr:CoA-binding protein [Deltaproteobacteria bacterium]